MLPDRETQDIRADKDDSRLRSEIFRRYELELEAQQRTIGHCRSGRRHSRERDNVGGKDGNLCEARQLA